MRMRLEFDLDGDGFDEAVFGQVTNDYLTAIDAQDANWFAVDGVIEMGDPAATEGGEMGGVQLPDVPQKVRGVEDEPVVQSSLSPGNSAYTPDDGGEVNSPTMAVAAREGAAEAELAETQASDWADEKGKEAKAEAAMVLGGTADPAGQMEPPRATVESPVVEQVDPVTPEAEEQVVEHTTVTPEEAGEPVKGEPDLQGKDLGAGGPATEPVAE